MKATRKNKPVKADVLIIGSGPAGLSAAISAASAGAKKVIVLERLPSPGGILTQCDHSGFGAKRYGRELTGIEYAARLISEAGSAGVNIITDCFVSSIDIIEQPYWEIQHACPKCKIINPTGLSCPPDRPNMWHTVDTTCGRFEAAAVVIATGCRERTIGNINGDSLAAPPQGLLTGTRPSGVFTAGTAQRMVNVGGMKVGNKAVVLGSGDIGLIVARRLIQTGTEVAMIIEKQPALSAMPGNIRSCVDAYSIQVMTSHTITALHGNARLEAVSVIKLDETGIPVENSGFEVPCDTLILSVGLIPELEIAEQYRLKYGEIPPNIFISGNAREILKMADDIAEDGARAGLAAAMIE